MNSIWLKLLNRFSGWIYGIAALVLGAFVVSTLVSQQSDQKRPQSSQPLTSPSVQIVKVETLSPLITGLGRLSAVRSAKLMTQLGGEVVFVHPQFRPGHSVKSGQVLVEINVQDLTFNLMAQKASFLQTLTQVAADYIYEFPDQAPAWERYLKQFDTEAPIRPLPGFVDDREEIFLSSRNLLGQYYQIKNLEAILDKSRVVAPFNGLVTAASVFEGDILRSQDVLGRLIQKRPLEVSLSVPLRSRDFVKIGQTATLESADLAGSWIGKVKRVGQSINAETQSVLITVEVDDPKLPEGLFVTVKIEAAPIKEATAIPYRLLKDNQWVSILENNQVKRQSVTPVFWGDESVIVKGLKPGQKLVTQPDS